jgi:bcr-type benzoyl-CoA reductase subunit C
MKNMESFRKISQDSYGYARKMKSESGKKIVGYFCSYAPEEIIDAAGAVPFRIFGRGGSSLADAHLQAYSCSLVRGALDDALSGELDFLDGVVFPHTCDSVQRLSDIWRINVKKGFHIDAVLPVKLDTESSARYMMDVMRKFKGDLEKKLNVEISPDDLNASADRFNRIRAYLNGLFRLRSENSGLIGSGELNAVVRAAMVMDRSRLLEELAGLAGSIDPEQPLEKTQGKRVVLAGGICNMPDIYSIIEASGGKVAGDDFCTGSRYFQGEISNKGDVLESIARRYMERINCPAKHSGLLKRGEHIIRLARETGAKGVIFLFLKFCDPHSFDYPYMKNMLDREGIPSMLFEIEDQLPSEGQFKTRCEAFFEML